jgi:hypothetical protein
MADSLLFDGTDDYIQFSVGGVSSSGAYTVAIAAKITADDTAFRDLIAWEFEGNASLGFENASPARLNVYGGSGPNVATSTFTCPASDGWCIYAWSRANGGGGKLHKYVWGTDTWTHESNATVIAADAAGRITIGANDGPSQYLDANILIAAWWNSELADGTIETLVDGRPAWVAASPVECWRLDTLSSISSLTGSSTESTRVGTTLDTDDAPSGWIDEEVGASAGYQRLVGPIALTGSAADLYTAPAGTRVEIRNMWINNPGGATVKPTLSIGADAASTRFINLEDIAAGGAYNARRAVNHTLEAGETIQGYTDTGSPVVVIDGYVERV